MLATFRDVRDILDELEDEYHTLVDFMNDEREEKGIDEVNKDLIVNLNYIIFNLADVYDILNERSKKAAIAISVYSKNGGNE